MSSGLTDLNYIRNYLKEFGDKMLDINLIKKIIRENSVFEYADSKNGQVDILSGNLHDIEFGGSPFFSEGSLPTLTTKYDQLESHKMYFKGNTEEQFVKSYLMSFYSWLLEKSAKTESTVLVKNQISSAQDIEKLFQGLPNQYSDQNALLTTGAEFTDLLSVLYASPALGICFNAGNKFFNRDLLSYNEALVLLPGKKKKKLITAERSAVILNLPQIVTPAQNDWSFSALEFKVIYPESFKVFELAP